MVAFQVNLATGGITLRDFSFVRVVVVVVHPTAAPQAEAKEQKKKMHTIRY
jgi:hypothetical protein